MATHSYIGKQNQNGTITAIYCHFDGYPSHHAPILIQHYDTEQKVDELLSLGDLSTLGEKIGDKQDFDNREYGQCCAYGRDRGEAGCEARVYTNEATFRGLEYYVYLFRDNKWHVSANGGPFVFALVPEES